MLSPPPSSGPGRRTAFTVSFLLSVFVLAVAGSAPAHNPNAPQTRLLVAFDPATSHAGRGAALARAGAVLQKHIGRLGVDVVSVPNATANAALTSLQREHAVLYTELDSTFEPQDFLPSDPSFPTGFAIAGGAWGWTKTRTTEAWDVSRGDPSVVVAVLDTGLKTAGLPDFGGQLVSGWNVVNGTSDVSASAGNHGTYVAGVVGLALDNGVGNTGYCPGCRIMPVQIGSDAGASLSNMASGIIWAVDHGARVINLSWAGSSSSTTLANAVSYARSKGVVVAAAAGNSNCDCVTYPAATPGVLGVASTNQSDGKNADSNFGSWVAIAAPAGNLTAWPAINGAPGYAPVGGTSLASPVVAAIAGLLFAAKSTLSGSDVEAALQSSAAPVDFPVRSGRVDALAALASVGVVPTPQLGPPVNLRPPSVLVETNGDYDAVQLSRPPAPGDILLRGQGSWSGAAPLNLSALRWDRCDGAGTCTTVATGAKYTVQPADTGFSFRLSVTVRNGAGSATVATAATAPVGGTPTPSTPPPSSTALPTISGAATEENTLAASPGSWSGSPTGFAYLWQRCDAAGATCAQIASATTASYTLGTADTGTTLRVAVTASNSGGSTTAASAPTQLVAAAPAPAPQPAAIQTQTFGGSLSGKTTVRRYTVAMGTGVASARLSFARCASLALTIRAPGGSMLSTSGPSVLSLSSDVIPGSYVYEVSGKGCSFSLEVTSPLP
jgi:hypothetical protein